MLQSRSALISRFIGTLCTNDQMVVTRACHPGTPWCASRRNSGEYEGRKEERDSRCEDLVIILAIGIDEYIAVVMSDFQISHRPESLLIN